MTSEQARGEGHRVDGRSDIFSLGVVLYELLAGRRPFRGDTLPEIIEQVTSYDPRPLRQHDEKLPKDGRPPGLRSERISNCRQLQNGAAASL